MFSISLLNLLPDGLKHHFDPLKQLSFSREFDWYRFVWIWMEEMHDHALPTPQHKKLKKSAGNANAKIPKFRPKPIRFQKNLNFLSRTDLVQHMFIIAGQKLRALVNLAATMQILILMAHFSIVDLDQD